MSEKASINLRKSFHLSSKNAICFLTKKFPFDNIYFGSFLLVIATCFSTMLNPNSNENFHFLNLSFIGPSITLIYFCSAYEGHVNFKDFCLDNFSFSFSFGLVFFMGEKNKKKIFLDLNGMWKFRKNFYFQSTINQMYSTQ